MEVIEYRQASKADIGLVIAQRSLFATELVGRQDEAAEAALREQLQAYFERELNKNYVCWLASINGQVVGSAGFVVREQPGNFKNPSGRWAYIMSVFTLPQHRRRGISARLMEHLLASGAEMNIGAFELHATKDGEPVYVKAGFLLHNEPTYRKFI